MVCFCPITSHVCSERLLFITHDIHLPLTELLCELPEDPDGAIHIGSEQGLNSPNGFQLQICFECLLPPALLNSVYRSAQKAVCPMLGAYVLGKIGHSGSAITAGMWAWYVAFVSVW